MSSNRRRTQTFLCVVILGVFIFFGTVQCDGENIVHVKSVKKDLEQEIKGKDPTPPQTEQKPNDVPEEKVQNKSSDIENKNTSEKKEQQNESAGIIAGNKVPTTTTTSSPASSVLVHQEEIIVDNNEEISDSLKTGFYFFAALSLSAIIFIVFKVYRLRLSRAERKYGVQGDRSTQELTPLPITIEDGHSDDEEDHTVFEVQRQNIRIL